MSMKKSQSDGVESSAAEDDTEVEAGTLQDGTGIPLILSNFFLLVFCVIILI